MLRVKGLGFRAQGFGFRDSWLLTFWFRASVFGFRRVPSISTGDGDERSFSSPK